MSDMFTLQEKQSVKSILKTLSDALLGNLLKADGRTKLIKVHRYWIKQLEYFEANGFKPGIKPGNSFFWLWKSFSCLSKNNSARSSLSHNVLLKCSTL